MSCGSPVSRARSAVMGAGRSGTSVAFHQHHRRRPVAVAVEQCADDAAIQNVVERGVVRFGRPVANEFVALTKAADAQTLVVGGTASEAAILRSPGFLN